MLRKSSPPGMCIAPGLSLLFCMCFLWFPLSRADELASRKSSRWPKGGSFSPELPAAYMEEFDNSGWYEAIANRQFSDTVDNRMDTSPGEETFEPTDLSTSMEPQSPDDARAVSTPSPPTGPGTPLFKQVFICKSSRSIYNVAILNKMGELLLPAFALSLEKASMFARCIREDLTDMVREDYLTFAMYNCVGTPVCSVNRETGDCRCDPKLPDKCTNIEYTRALTSCIYGT